MNAALALDQDWDKENGQRQYLVQGSHVSQLPGWLLPTVEQIQELLQLLPDWDSYGALPIDPDNAVTLVEVLLSALPDDCPVPQLVPATDGNLQAEWHDGGFDIELLCEHPTKIRLYVAERASGREVENILSVDLTPLRDALRCLSMKAHD